MTISALQYFQALASYRSFSRASASLFISQSALSHCIQALEKELGVPLIQRQGNECRLTPFGEQLLAYTNDIFEELDNLQARLHESAPPFSKPLRLTVRMGLSPLESMLNEFRTLWPNARLELHQSDQSRMAHVPWDFTFINQSEPNLTSFDTLLFAEDFQLAVNRDHPLASQKNVSLQQLNPYSGIRLLLSRALQDQLDQAFHAANFHPDWSIVSDHYHFIFRQIREGDHWALLPCISICPQPKDSIVFVPVRDLSVKRYVILRRNPNHYFSRSMQLFQEFSRNFFANAAARRSL